MVLHFLAVFIAGLWAQFNYQRMSLQVLLAVWIILFAWTLIQGLSVMITDSIDPGSKEYFMRVKKNLEPEDAI